MLRFLFRLTLLTVGILICLIQLMKPVGSLRPMQAVTAGLDYSCKGLPQPCWFGVRLGVTTVANVRTLFEPFGDSIYDNTAKGQLEIFKTTQGGCFAQFVYGKNGSTVINEIILVNCTRLRLGDLLAHYGEPETLETSISCDPTHPIIQHDNYVIEYPAEGILAVINRPTTLRPWLSLQGNVSLLYLVPPHPSEGRKTWAGLMSFERFVRLHPEQIRNSTCGP